MLSLRTHVFILLGLLGALLALPAVTAVLQASGMPEAPRSWRLPGLILVFGLVVAVGFAAVPVMVMTVLRFQKAAGNEGVPAVRAATSGQKVIVWVMWALMGAGLAIAASATIAGGLFGPEATRTVTGAAPGRSEGVLLVRPGMTLEEMARWSTLKLEIESRYGGPAPVVAAVGTFDIVVAGTGLRLPEARYYYVSTSKDAPGVVDGVSIGTAPNKLTRAELEAADDALRRRLAAEGWLTGHEVYRTAEDRALHEGRTEGPEGHIWLRNGVVLSLRGKRMDEALPFEEPGAGEWIQYVDLSSQQGYGGIERFEFGPWRGGGSSAEASSDRPNG